MGPLNRFTPPETPTTIISPAETQSPDSHLSHVWLLDISHRHERDLSVHRTEEGAEKQLLSYVHDWWHEAQKRSHNDPDYDDLPDDPPADPEGAVQNYFEIMDDEEATTERIELLP